MRVLQLAGAVVSLGLVLTGQARAQVVVSQVYGGGGNSGAAYRSDFIELHNNGTSAVSLSGWSVQYASAAGSSWQVTPLGGSIAPGGYYLVKQADGSGGTVDLPTPDANGTIAMSGTAGKVALSNSTTALTGTCPTATVVDLVGFGSSANCAEGNAPTPAPSNTLAVLRKDSGCTDSNNNGADFATAQPAPRNSASAAFVCGGNGQPVLSVADGSADERSPAVLLQVSLTQPAGPGGVSVDYTTVDGTATAGSDYVARSGTLTLPEGVAGFLLQVSLVDDAAAEGNETFQVDFSNVRGAILGTTRATVTIVDDDFNVLPIHAIQGSGARSPYVDQVVATSGIVTARRSAGFFVQMPDAEADGDPRTSEGIYVYTGSAPPAVAAVGNRVTVRGTVAEYVPSADPAQPPLTEIVSPVVNLESTGNPLPAPVLLTPQFPDPDGAYDQLEALEGMRVTANSLTVNTPTLGNVSEASGTGSSNGVFHVVVTGVGRGYRRPGVQMPDPLPAGSPGDVPRWNTNPQVLAVGSAGLGGERIDVAAGCVVRGVTGPLDYSFRRYTIYPEAAPQVECDGSTAPRPAPAPQADDVSVATYNLQRFFDDQNDPAIGEPVLSSAAYQARLNKASLAVRDYLHLPDILGVVEIENLAVLQALAARIGTDAVANGQPDPAYAAFLVEGNDVGGIDVGFLIKTAEVGAGLPRVQVQQVQQIGKATTWTEPGGGTSLLNDRPPLLAEVVVNFADGRQLPLTAIVVHQRSLNGAETDDASGDRIRAKRQAQADFLAGVLQQRQLANPDEHVLVMGDFNAFEFNDGYVDAMGTVTGLPSPDAQTVVAGDGVDRVDPDYDNLTWLLPPDQSYSYAYDGNVQSLDHILASQALMRSPLLQDLAIGHARINADFPEIARNDASTPTRLSDHDPTVVLLKLQVRRLADLGVAANADVYEVAAGQDAVFVVDVDNHGPDAAAHAALGFALDAAVDVEVAAAAGWDCEAPQVDTRTVFSCTTPGLASGGSARFILRVPTDAALAGSELPLAVSVRSQTDDPQPGNDSAEAAVAITAVPAANLAVVIDGPASVPVTQISAQYRVTVANRGNAAALSPVVRLDGNTLAATASVAAPAGWQCQKLAANGGAREVGFTCSSSQPLAAGGATVFQLKANTRPAPAGGVIVVEAAASSASADADPSDNQASFRTQAACTGRGC